MRKNLCIFIGRLTRDPDMRVTPSGLQICNFSVAVGERWKDKVTGEMKELTEFINCVSFGKQAEYISNYVKKGDLVDVTGKFRTQRYVKDGIEIQAVKINVDELLQLTPKNSTESQRHISKPQNPKPQTQKPTQPPADFDDDIPF